jgi:uncharacterized integral membrane protein (TIGR00698 family)
MYIRRRTRRGGTRRATLHGAATLAAVVALAWPAGRLVPALGAPVFALLVGILVRTRHEPPRASRRAISMVSHYALQLAVVMLGATLSLGHVGRVGLTSWPTLLTTLAVALVAAFALGRVLRVPARLTALVGVGTGICGASAIAAVSGVVAATELEIAYALSTIFVFNVVAVLLFPLIGELLGLSQHTFGVWAGTAVNDTSSVLAAAYAFGDASGDVAVVTKLARTTMIVPIALVLAVMRARASGGGARPSVHRAVPLFLVWFLVASVLNTVGAVGPGLADALSSVVPVVIAVALAGVGVSIRLGDLRGVGPRPLILGGAVWALLSVTGLVVQLVV